MRISAREACVKPHLRTRSDINTILCSQVMSTSDLLTAGENVWE